MASQNVRKRRSRLLSTPKGRTSGANHPDSPTAKRPRPSPPAPERVPSASHLVLGLRRILASDTKDSATKATAPTTTATATATAATTATTTIAATKATGQKASPAPSQEPQTKEILGPLIRLWPKTYLGRTPPSVTRAMAAHKPLDETWTAEDFRSVSKTQACQVREFAPLGIYHDKSSCPNAKQIQAVSRKLLRVVRGEKRPSASGASVTLQRSPAARKEDGKTAFQTRVGVCRKRPKPFTGIENEPNSQSSHSSTESNVFVEVPPSERVVLYEGDTLLILNQSYRYRVVSAVEEEEAEIREEAKPNDAALASAATSATEKSAISTSITTGNPVPQESSGVIEILESSSGSSHSSPEGGKTDPTRLPKKTAVGAAREEGTQSKNSNVIELLESSSSSSSSPKGNDDRTLKPKAMESYHTRKRQNSSCGRESLSSVNDRTIALSMGDAPEAANGGKESRIALNDPSETKTPAVKTSPPLPDHAFRTPEVIDIASSSSGSQGSDENSRKIPAKDDTADSKTTSLPTRGRITRRSRRNHTQADSSQPTNGESSRTTRRSLRRHAKASDKCSENGTLSKKENPRGTHKGPSTEEKSPDAENAPARDRDSPRNHLRRKGTRIKSVFWLEENDRGEVVERPIHEVMGLARGESTTRGNTETRDDRGDILTLESPTHRFWDPSWSGISEKVHPTVVTPKPNEIPVRESTEAATIPTSQSMATQATSHEIESARSPSAEALEPEMLEFTLPPPTDMPASLAIQYWNALNSPSPREGAWYLDMAMEAGNTVPGPLLCQKWMALLTWGPKTLVHSNSSPTHPSAPKRRFSWDGPRMDFAVTLWKKAIRHCPRIVLPRMIASSPGGPSEWWKTCLSYDELAEDENEHVRVKCDERSILMAAQREIGSLRMQSVRLDALLYLLKTNLAFEEEEHAKLQYMNEREQTMTKPSTTRTHRDRKEKGDKSDSDDEEDLSSDEEEDETASSREDILRCVVFLREIRSLGAKPVLRVVAQAMSKFWVSQRNYLGYPEDPSEASVFFAEEDTVLWADQFSFGQEHAEIVEQVANQLAKVLRVMRSILESPFNTPLVSSLNSTCRRSRRQRVIESTKLPDSEIGDILWNAMDREVRERVPRSIRPQKNIAARCPGGYQEPSPREAFMVDWLWVLHETMGNDFAMEIAKKVGLTDHYEAICHL